MDKTSLTLSFPQEIKVNQLISITTPLTSDFIVEWYKIYSPKLQSEGYYLTLIARLLRYEKLGINYSLYQDKPVQKCQFSSLQYQTSFLDYQCVLICQVTYTDFKEKKPLAIRSVFAVRCQNPPKRSLNKKPIHIKIGSFWKQMYIKVSNNQIILQQKSKKNYTFQYSDFSKMRIIKQQSQLLFQAGLKGIYSEDKNFEMSNVEIIFQKQDLEWFLIQVNYFKDNYIKSMCSNLKSQTQSCNKKYLNYCDIQQPIKKQLNQRETKYCQDIIKEQKSSYTWDSKIGHIAPQSLIQFQCLKQFNQLFQEQEKRLSLQKSFDNNSQEKQKQQKILKQIKEKRIKKQIQMNEIKQLRQQLKSIIQQERQIIETNLKINVEINKLKRPTGNEQIDELKSKLLVLLKEQKLLNTTDQQALSPTGFKFKQDLRKNSFKKHFQLVRCSQVAPSIKDTNSSRTQLKLLQGARSIQEFKQFKDKQSQSLFVYREQK